MKKFLVVVALVAFAAPAFGAANPFIDVPLNHWAYDAIAQLYATGTIGGYPDGTYRGSNPMTRYEIAALVARALASVDMRKADKAQVEELRKLVIEFGEELEALGVKDSGGGTLDGKIGERLGGWKISGIFRVDVQAWALNSVAGGVGTSGSYGNPVIARSGIYFDKWFGENEKYRLHARLREGTSYGVPNAGVGGATYNSADRKDVVFQYFYVEMPGWWESKVTVGRFNRNYTAAYNWDTYGATDRGFYSLVSDVDRDGFAFDKNFTMGNLGAYLSKTPAMGMDVSAWELGFMGSLQFSEKIAFDLGTQAWLLADDLGKVKEEDDPLRAGDKIKQISNAWTLYGGLRFNLNEYAALKGIYYLQQQSWDGPEGTEDPDGANAWKVIVDIKQEQLRFTSLWLEYGMVDGVDPKKEKHQGFVHAVGGTVRQYLIDSGNWGKGANNVFPVDVSIWRVGTRQKWTDKWSTWLAASSIDGDYDFSTMQLGLGIEYTASSSVGLALGFVNTTVDDHWWPKGNKDKGAGTWAEDNSFLFFRTQITF